MNNAQSKRVHAKMFNEYIEREIGNSSLKMNEDDLSLLLVSGKGDIVLTGEIKDDVSYLLFKHIADGKEHKTNESIVRSDENKTLISLSFNSVESLDVLIHQATLLRRMLARRIREDVELPT